MITFAQNSIPKAVNGRGARLRQWLTTHFTSAGVRTVGRTPTNSQLTGREGRKSLVNAGNDLLSFEPAADVRGQEFGACGFDPSSKTLIGCMTVSHGWGTTSARYAEDVVVS
jgi:hypothetical protein